MTIDEGRGLMASTDDLMREIERLRDENTQLRDLLQTHGIPLPTTAQDADSTAELNASSSSIVTKHSSMAEKTALFLSLFQGRIDIYARRWEAGTDGRATALPVKTNGSRAYVSSQRASAQSALMRSIAPMTQLPSKRICLEKLCWASIRCFRMKPAVSSPLILMKKAGVQTSQ